MRRAQATRAMRGAAPTRAASAMASLAMMVSSAGCANQTPVIPMLHVEPNAGARIFYFEKRAAAMFGTEPAKAGESEDVAVDEGASNDEVVLQTWGVPAPLSQEGSSSGRLPNEPLAIPSGTTSVGSP